VERDAHDLKERRLEDKKALGDLEGMTGGILRKTLQIP
jgi:hypothetical protein